MIKIDHIKGQAATELAVFGAILIFLLGTIVRTAASNSYTQNQNFKAMRMAMLASWNGSKATNSSRNNASILFVEDRLAPDFNKYGDLDRNPYVAQGAGSFSYQLLYPLDISDVGQNLPIMDTYINGQHFPFTTASFVSNRTINRPAASACQYPANSCAQNQCLRNVREWVGGIVNLSEFESVVPIVLTDPPATRAANELANATGIFNELVNEGYISVLGGGATQGIVNAVILSATFDNWFTKTFPSPFDDKELTQIQSILQSDDKAYKLFYTHVANGTDQFTITPPTCANPNTTACKDKALSSSLQVLDATGANYTNTNGDMQYDLLRLGNYVTPPNPVDTQFPPVSSCSAASLRCDIAWQWAATAGTTPAMIGLDTTNNQYPSYDVDGRLKEVTIYSLSQNPDGTPNVSYEDFQGGDIDSTWDINSCGPKPGLQDQAQIFSFTGNGTYLQIKEGGLYNPETGQVVRSANVKQSIDLIQRIVQLSNNTGRFCNGTTPQPCVGGACTGGSDPNPVEVCVDESSAASNCFTSSNIAQTCFDLNDNILYVRSRLEDQRGRGWATSTNGQLQVQQ